MTILTNVDDASWILHITSWKCIQWLEVVVCRLFSAIFFLLSDLWTTSEAMLLQRILCEVAMKFWTGHGRTATWHRRSLSLPSSPLARIYLRGSLLEGGGLNLTVLHNSLQRSE